MTKNGTNDKVSEISAFVGRNIDWERRKTFVTNRVLAAPVWMEKKILPMQLKEAQKQRWI